MNRIYPLVPLEDPILHRKIEGVSKVNRKEFAEMMIMNMIHHKGIGLSANQIGFDERVFAMRDLETKENFVCFNPSIITSSINVTTLDEGCLSFPKDVTIAITRPEKVTVSYETEFGLLLTRSFDGLLSKVFQHELDHLNGITMLDRISTK